LELRSQKPYPLGKIADGDVLVALGLRWEDLSILNSDETAARIHDRQVPHMRAMHARHSLKAGVRGADRYYVPAHQLADFHWRTFMAASLEPDHAKDTEEVATAMPRVTI